MNLSVTDLAKNIG